MGVAAVEQLRHQALPLEGQVGYVDAGQVRDGREDIQGRGRAVDGLRLTVRDVEDQRDVQDLLVEVEPVVDVSVLLEAVAVIAGDDDDGAVVFCG